MASQRHPDLEPVHPGEILREDVIPALRRSKTEIARLLGISRETLYKLLRCEQGVTPDLAARIGKLCGNGPGLWLRLQAEHDSWRAMKIDTSHIPTLRAA
jgi:antitoxin HigA-1